ncbi:hypothetical protein [Kozakia baliensis]|uniref:hypothetical protein n=1 Tax=Kozakia baliensis TaxID=153496 RepID=UPI00087B3BB3|nr:hypothetical protein [Kozakia baliensis]AOX19927.1 hypothetical protein A0U90_06090 [Kozakia baliensis]
MPDQYADIIQLTRDWVITTDVRTLPHALNEEELGILHTARTIGIDMLRATTDKWTIQRARGEVPSSLNENDFAALLGATLPVDQPTPPAQDPLYFAHLHVDQGI